MTTFPDLRELRTRWRQSPLLRWGVLCILLILAVYLLLIIGDAGRAVQHEVGALQDRHSRLQSLLRENEWEERAESARALRVQLESRLWPAASPGLAQANVQSWLGREVGRAGFANSRIQVESAQPVASLKGILRISARVEGLFAPAPLLQLLRAVETNRHLTVVKRLEVENNRFILLMNAYGQAAGERNE